MRGGEAVLESLCTMFPDAVIYTHVYDPTSISSVIKSHKIRTSFINSLPWARSKYRAYLPLMPVALEILDLTDYDLVISSESGPAKGVIVRPDAVHICYTHSPMRYVWDQYHVYRSSAGFLTRLVMPLIAHYLRYWDVSTSARVDYFIANSSFVKMRINRYYRRESSVVFPPVSTEQFECSPPEAIEDYYLWVGELVPYKKPELVVEACKRMGKRLVVIGSGDSSNLSKGVDTAKVKFLGRVSDAVMRGYMSKCRALLFPGVEDFGIVPVEVMASGRPVIAYAAGGALDTVIDGKTGVLFNDQTVEGLIAAITRFELELMRTLDSAVIQSHANTFNEESFVVGIEEILNKQVPRLIPNEKRQYAELEKPGYNEAVGMRG